MFLRLKVKSTRTTGSETAIDQAASESASKDREASHIAKEMRKLELGDLDEWQRKDSKMLKGKLVEGTSVITGPKCNKGPICNNIWTQA